MIKTSFKLTLLLLLAGFVAQAQNFTVSGSNTHSVALCNGGQVYNWGKNDQGQLGIQRVDTAINGDLTFVPFDANVNENSPQLNAQLTNIFQIDAGSGSHTLARTCDGKVFAWGLNSNGQLGNNSITANSSALATFVMAGEAVQAGGNPTDTLEGVFYVSGGNDESYAILEDGTLLAWGQNDKGQLGNGTSNPSDLPVFVDAGESVLGQTAGQPLQNVIQVEAGDETGYALTADGTVWSWGSNGGNNEGDVGAVLGRGVLNGVLETSNFKNRAWRVQFVTGISYDNLPVPPADFITPMITSISAGDRHLLMTDDQGVVWSLGGDWGPGQRGNGWGSFSNDGNSLNEEPWTLPFATRVLSGQSVNDTQFLGDGDPIVQLAAGQSHSLAVSASGLVYSWGSNVDFTVSNANQNVLPVESGHLGVGTAPTEPDWYEETLSDEGDFFSGKNGVWQSPMQVQVGGTNANFPNNAVGVSDGDNWSFVTTSDGRIYVAGHNNNGQLGIGTSATNAFTFQEIVLPNTCSLPIECPSFSLGDAEVCPGMYTISTVNRLPPGFVARWTRPDGTEVINTNSNGLGGDFININLTETIVQEGEYTLSVTDNRPPTDRPCEPCALITEIANISYPTPDFFDPGGLTYCSDIGLVNVNSSSPNDIYNWYPTLTGGTIADTLGQTVGSTSTTIDLSAVMGIGTKTVYVEAAGVGGEFLRRDTDLCSTTLDNQKFLGTGAVNAEFQQGFDVLAPITLNSLSFSLRSEIFNEGQTRTTNVNFNIYRSTTNNGNIVADQNTVVSAFTYPFSRTRNAGDNLEEILEVVFPVDVDLAPGTYFLSMDPNPNTGRNDNFNLQILSPSCDQGIVADNLSGNIVQYLKGSNDFNSNQDRAGHFYDFQFTADPTYTCARIPVELTEDCKCAKPDAVAVEPDFNVCLGADTELDGSFTPNGSGNNTITDPSGVMSYVWYRAGDALTTASYLPLPNGTTTTLPPFAVNNVVTANGGDWILRVQDGTDPLDASCYTESTLTIAIDPDPTWTINPGGTQDLCAAEAFEVTATATGAGITYQWQKNGVDIPGETSNTLRIASVVAADAGTFTLTASGTCGDITSNPFELTIKDPTAISTDLSTTPLLLCPTDVIDLSVAASGENVTYQWTLNGAPIVGATTNSLMIPTPLTVANSGNYQVQVNAECGNLLSAITSITVRPTTELTDPTLADPSLCPMDNLNLIGSAVGADLVYTWTQDGNTIGGNSNTYTKNNIVPSDAGSYILSVAGACGTDASSPINITVGIPTAISVDPMDVGVCLNESASFSVTATGDNRTYEWFRGTTSVQGPSASLTYAIPSAGTQDEGDYTVVVRGECGTVTSGIGTLTITPLAEPQVSLAQDETICSGDDVTFTAIPTNGGALPTYRFLVGGVEQQNSALATFTATNLTADLTVTVEMTSNSTCIDPAFTNPFTSNPVTATVIQPPTATITTPATPSVFAPDATYAGITVTTNNPTNVPTWSIVSGQGTLSATNNTTIDLEDLIIIEPDPSDGTGTTVVSVSVADLNGVCDPEITQVTIIRKIASTPIINDDEICVTELPYTLQGSPAVLPTFETGSFTDVDGGSGAVGTVYPNTTSIDITDATIASGVYNYTYSVFNSVTNSTTSDNAAITIHRLPSTADAGTGGIICSSTFPLNAVPPTEGTGLWTCDAGTVNNPTSAAASLDDIPLNGTVNCTWTVTNGTCPPSSDVVTITNIGGVTPAIIYRDGTPVSGTLDLCIDEVFDLSGEPIANGGDVVQWDASNTTSITNVSGNTPAIGNLNIIAPGTTTLTYTTSNPALSTCPPNVASLTLNVFAIPVADILSVSNSDACADDELITITTAPVGTNTGNWTSPKPPTGGPTDWTTRGSDLAIGVNTLTWVVSNEGCPDASDSEDITVTPTVTPSIGLSGIQSPYCVGESTNINVRVDEGGGPGTTFSFVYGGVPLPGGLTADNFATIDNLVETTPTGTLLEVTMFSDARCRTSNTATASRNIIVVPGPMPVINTTDSTICETDRILIDGEDLAPLVAGRPAPTYRWELNNSPIPLVTGTDIPSTNIPGVYTLIANSSVCGDVVSNPMVLTVDRVPVVNMPDLIDGFENTVVPLDATTNGARDEWFGPLGVVNIDDITQASTQATLITGGQYSLSLTSYSINEVCQTTGIVPLLIRTPVATPNVFTPNGDGDNDVFKMKGMNTHPQAVVSIFNRWGSRVYETDNYDLNEWDGGTSTEGVYYFVIDFDGVIPNRSGVVHLIK